MSEDEPKLRVKRRSLPAPRLVEHGDADPRDKPPLEVSGGLAGRPLTLMRLGGADLRTGVRAAAANTPPSAIVLSIAEQREIAARARRLSAEFGIARLTDPLLFRTALEGYRTAPNLQSLDYTPGRDANPFRYEEFEDGELRRHVGRSVIGAQVDLGASAAFSGAFVVEGMNDPWMPVNQHLLRIGSDAAAAWGMPLIGVLPLRLEGFREFESRRWLVQALSSTSPAAWMLLADGLSESSTPEQMVAALELAAELRAAGGEVLLGRSGDLRELFWAFGFGAEFGLGRMLRFSVPDFSSRRRGPGPPTGPRMEFPSLVSSVPQARALELLRNELLPEADCDCAACQRGGPLHRNPEEIPGHDAHIVLTASAQLAGINLPTRVRNYEQRLIAAIHEWRRAELEGGRLGRPRHLERRLTALRLAVESGLLEPARFGAGLSLFE
jgi:hypothetical protein